jgi:hypothetical protein
MLCFGPQGHLLVAEGDGKRVQAIRLGLDADRRRLTSVWQVRSLPVRYQRPTQRLHWHVDNFVLWLSCQLVFTAQAGKPKWEPAPCGKSRRVHYLLSLVRRHVHTEPG